MIARYREIRALYRIDAVFVYELFDESYWQGQEATMGLIKLKESAGGFWSPAGHKQAFEAVQGVIAAGPGLAAVRP